jgi:hypothetical protein
MADSVLQIELDRQRVEAYPDVGGYGPESKANWKAHKLLSQALWDTIHNGGTFVVHVTDTTITAVQRDDTPDIGAGS